MSTETESDYEAEQGDQSKSPDQLAPGLKTVAEYQEEYGKKMSGQTLMDEVGRLTAAFENIQNFDPGSRAHIDIRNRMIGAQWAAAEQGQYVTSEVADGKKPDDASDYQMAIRIDGGIDVVNGDGAKAIERGGSPEPDQIAERYSPPVDERQEAARVNLDKLYNPNGIRLNRQRESL